MLKEGLSWIETLSQILASSLRVLDFLNSLGTAQPAVSAPSSWLAIGLIGLVASLVLWIVQQALGGIISSETTKLWNALFKRSTAQVGLAVEASSTLDELKAAAVAIRDLVAANKTSVAGQSALSQTNAQLRKDVEKLTCEVSALSSELLHRDQTISVLKRSAETLPPATAPEASGTKPLVLN